MPSKILLGIFVFTFFLIGCSSGNNLEDVPATQLPSVSNTDLQTGSVAIIPNPGEIVVDTMNFILWYTTIHGDRLRYPIGVGRKGYEWSGTASIGLKKEWPTWTPPKEMIERQPELQKYATGMPGGINNPLGARALYLYKDDKDTLYRIHGTNNPDSIGSAESSGCIRMMNADVIELYKMVQKGVRVTVL